MGFAAERVERGQPGGYRCYTRQKLRNPVEFDFKWWKVENRVDFGVEVWKKVASDIIRW